MDGLEEKLNKLLSDPEALGSVMKMAQSIAGGGDSVGAAPPGLPAPSGGGLNELMGGIDPQMMGHIMRLLSEFNRTDDRRLALISALKPYVRGDRRDKMDKAAQMVRLARTAKLALGSFGGGEDV